MNEVLVSGILAGVVKEFGEKGVAFKLVVTNQGAGGTSHSDELACLAFGTAAQVLKGRANSGERVTFSGRIDRDKLGGEKYHTVLVASNVLSISASENGMDSATVTLAGPSEIKEFRTVGAKDTPLIPFTVIATRSFNGNEFKSYISCSAWSSQAEILRNYENQDGINLAVQGSIKTRTYEDKDGDNIRAIDVWANNLTVFGAGSITTSAEGDSGGNSVSMTTPPPVQRRESFEDDLPF